MTGCPNGCARPYQSDIGIVGRSGDKYTLFVGGRILGDRLNFPLKDLVPRAEIVPTLVPILENFKTERQNGESFGDFCHRLGIDKLRELLPKDVAASGPLVSPARAVAGRWRGDPDDWTDQRRRASPSRSGDAFGAGRRGGVGRAANATGAAAFAQTLAGNLLRRLAGRRAARLRLSLQQRRQRARDDHLLLRRRSACGRGRRRRSAAARGGLSWAASMPSGCTRLARSATLITSANRVTSGAIIAWSICRMVEPRRPSCSTIRRRPRRRCPIGLAGAPAGGLRRPIGLSDHVMAAQLARHRRAGRRPRPARSGANVRIGLDGGRAGHSRLAALAHYGRCWVGDDPGDAADTHFPLYG